MFIVCWLADWFGFVLWAKGFTVAWGLRGFAEAWGRFLFWLLAEDTAALDCIAGAALEGPAVTLWLAFLLVLAPWTVLVFVAAAADAVAAGAGLTLGITYCCSQGDKAAAAPPVVEAAAVVAGGVCTCCTPTAVTLFNGGVFR